MEIENKNATKISVALSVLLFFGSLVVFQFWLEPQADFPHTDEYQSILSALGFPTYTPNLHVQMLTFFSHFFHDFFSIVKFNFIASHLFLAVTFFSYHFKKGLSLGTNFFFTAILTLSTINIALTRKMHFWAAAFFFLILFFADFLEGKQKKVFLFLSLLGLGFFRVEFLFSAAVALAFLAGELIFSFRDKKKLMAFIFISGCVLSVLGITTFGYGMKDLLRESFKIKTQSPDLLSLFATWIKLFLNNIVLHFYYTVVSFFTTLRIFFPTLAVAFAWLLFLSQKTAKENWMQAKKIVQFSFLPYYVPAMAALYSVRFMDFYIIMTFVVFLSCFAFLLNAKRSIQMNMSILMLVLPAFFVLRPDLKGSAYINFPTFKRGERIHRQMFNLIAHLPVKKGNAPYKILYNQYVVGVLPNEGRDFYMNADLKNICKQGTVAFDVVLLTGKWFSDPNQKLIESCVLPGIINARHLILAPGYDLYLGPRISADFP